MQIRMIRVLIGFKYSLFGFILLKSSANQKTKYITWGAIPIHCWFSRTNSLLKIKCYSLQAWDVEGENRRKISTSIDEIECNKRLTSFENGNTPCTPKHFLYSSNKMKQNHCMDFTVIASPLDLSPIRLFRI